jgi:hypothetical protein
MKRPTVLLSDRGRKIVSTIFFGLFGASVMANVVLLAERPASISDRLPPAFRLGHPFYPICYTRTDGFVVMRSASRNFVKQLVGNLPYTRWRKWNNTAITTKWYWQNKQDQIWNATRSLAEYMHFKRTGERVTDAERRKLKTESCPFIRKYAME